MKKLLLLAVCFFSLATAQQRNISPGFTLYFNDQVTSLRIDSPFLEVVSLVKLREQSRCSVNNEFNLFRKKLASAITTTAKHYRAGAVVTHAGVGDGPAQLFYVDSEFDITSEVIDVLNREYLADRKTTAASIVEKITPLITEKVTAGLMYVAEVLGDENEIYIVIKKRNEYALVEEEVV